MNNDSKFRSVPKQNNFVIPFKLEEKALLGWLVELTYRDGEEACSETIALLQAMNKIEPQKNRLSLLKMIYEYLGHYFSRLKGECWDAGIPLSTDETTYVEMIAWNYLLLGQSFFIAAEQTNKKDDALFSAAMALQVLGQAQLHIAATYSDPNDGFWSLLYQIFAWAEKKKFLHLPVEDNPLKGLTINTLFATNLIFYLCDINQFHARDMRTIFKFLPKFCVDLPITLYPEDNDGLFMLDLKYDNPPHDVEKQTELGSDLVRYFSPVIVAEAIDERILQREGDMWSGTLRSINTALFARVAKTLGLQQERRHHRKAERRNLLGVIGFENIVGFLYKITKNLVINLRQPRKQQKPDDFSDDPYFGSDDASDPLGFDTDYQHEESAAKPMLPTTEAIWEEQDNKIIDIPVKNVSLQPLKICDSSMTGYSVSWTQSHGRAKVGDLFGIISEDKKRLEVAIIRRVVVDSGDIIHKIAQNTGVEIRGELSSEFKVGAELLGFESEIAYLCGVEKQGAAWAVFIPEFDSLARPNTIVYKTGVFTTGDTVYMHKGNDETILCLLLKELHSTAGFSHVEIVFMKE